MRTPRLVISLGLVLVLAACGNTGTTVGTLNTVPVAASAVPTATTVPTVAVPTPSPVPTETEQPAPTTAPTIAPTEVVPTATEAAETATAEAAGAVPSDLAGKIAFVRGSDVWLYLPRTGEARQLVGGTTDARWSPDGTRLTFVREDGLYLADGEGKNERRVHEAGRLTTPVWSPDGTRLAFEVGLPADAPGAREVWVYDLAEPAARKVAMGMDPAWAPDSKRIAYVTAPGDEGFRRNQLRLVSWRGEHDWAVVKDLPPDLPKIGVPGGEPERSGLEHGMATPVWDKDGRYIYVPSFVIYQALSDFFIWERADSVNGGSTFVAEIPGGEAIPAPDNQAALITANSARGDSWFVAKGLGEDDTSRSWAQAPKGITALAPAWAPDAQAVAYYHCELEQPERCDLRVVSPEGNAILVPDVFGGAAPNYAAPLSLSWGRDG